MKTVIKTINGTRVVNTDVDRHQARALLEDAYNTIIDRICNFKHALNAVAYYDAAEGKFNDVVGQYDSARERAYAAIARLDDMADELFPLFEEDKETE